MAWATERVIAGEIASDAEARMSQINVYWDWAETPNYTGRYAAELVGPGSGLGHSFRNHASIRIGYWLTTRGWYEDSQFDFFRATEPFPTPNNFERACWRIKMDWDSHLIRLEEYWDGSGSFLSNATSLDPRGLIGNVHDWKHISLYYVPSTGVIKFWVNGELLIDSTMTLARQSSRIYVAASGYLGDFGGYMSVDDAYFDGSSSVESASKPPARRYYHADPDGAGNYSQWTPNAGNNYEAVDDIGTPDDDTTYVGTGSNGNIDTYTFSSLSNVYPDVTVDGAVVQAYCRTEPIDATGYLKMKARLAGVDDETDPLKIIPEKLYENNGVEYFGDWCVITGWFPTDPSAATWTESNFNSAEFGMESSGLI